MNIEFHYWITGLIAYRSGFDKEDALKIAYSSQYVDENDLCRKIVDRKGKMKPYRNFISQTMNILKPKQELMRIYPIFHFVPGEPDADTARRRDGKMHLLNTTPNSRAANELLDEAFKASTDSRLYRIGIATHAFADTWAHQNFVGWYDYFNNIGMDVKPDIGHANAEHHPDWMSHRWVDNRLVDSDIDNRSRMLSAAKALFEKYCAYHQARRKLDNRSNWSNLEKELMFIHAETYTGAAKKYEKGRMSRVRMLLDWPAFDEKKWFDQAVISVVRGMKDRGGIWSNLFHFEDAYFWREDIRVENTDWYRFQEAVKQHERFGIELLSPVFKKMGYDLAAV
ncbi:MAG: DUF6765 family protein [Desulfobacterales bacterium]